jgi:hypothetical protein
MAENTNESCSRFIFHEENPNKEVEIKKRKNREKIATSFSSLNRPKIIMPPPSFPPNTLTYSIDPGNIVGFTYSVEYEMNRIMPHVAQFIGLCSANAQLNQRTPGFIVVKLYGIVNMASLAKDFETCLTYAVYNYQRRGFDVLGLPNVFVCHPLDYLYVHVAAVELDAIQTNNGNSSNNGSNNNNSRKHLPVIRLM